MRNFATLAILAAALWTPSTALAAGPYSLGADDPTNPYDAPIPGFIGPAGDGSTAIGNYVNPEFIGWATGYQDLLITDTNWTYMDPSMAFGPVAGDLHHVVSLGDLDPDMIAAGDPVGTIVGTITLTFDTPIRNGVGADFAGFENGFYAEEADGQGTVVGQILAELAYVQVSTDGVTWLEFESDSLTPCPPPDPDGYGYMTIDPTDVYNFFGKHTNGYGKSWGTPFDLDEFANHSAVLAGLVDLQQIHYVKIVDIPGNGDHVDVNVPVPGSAIFLDSDGDPIYDAWITWGSGGVDVEALGVLNEMPDFDGDGDVDGDDFDILCDNLGSADLHYDLDGDGDADTDDLAYMVANNLQWDNGVSSGYGTIEGDFNLDGTIDTTDLTILATNFGLDVGWSGGNANCDDVIDTTDLTILATNFGFVAAGASAPEPATIGLLGLGWLALARRRKA